MKKFVFAILGAFALSILAIAILIKLPTRQALMDAHLGAFTIQHINVVDVETGTTRPDMTVIVADGRITHIVPSAGHEPPVEATVFSGRGKFMLPGLWDMHSHSIKVSPQLHHPLLIANGVTALRDMSGCLDKNDPFWACIHDREHWNTEAIAGNRVSPRYILQSSFQMNGRNAIPDQAPSFFKLEESSHADMVADFYKNDGADFIKVYEELSVQQYVNLASSAASYGLDIAGHLPTKVSLRQALQAGHKSIEHGRLFFMECYSDIEAFRNLDDPIRTHYRNYRGKFIDQQDDSHCTAVMDEMARSDTWWTPTLGTLKMGAFADDPSFRGDPRLRYITKMQEALVWGPDADHTAAHAKAENGRHLERELFDLSLKHVGEAHRRGVKLLVGTDTLDTYVFPGFAVHDELAMMVEAGLSPLAALQAATVLPARFSGLEQNTGTVKEGKWADLLILNTNPLDNITSTQDIFAVVSHGFYYDRAALDHLLAFTKEQAASLQTNVKLLWSMVSSPLMRRQIAD